MNWIFMSIIVIVSSVINCLVIRKLILGKVSLEIQRLANFILPTFLFLIYIVLFKLPWQINLFQFFLILISSILFSWLGSVWSMKGLEQAPNPAYSLVISKTYIVLTAILSVWIFGITFQTKGILAILAIILFSSLIIIDKKSRAKNQVKKGWILYTLGAFFAWGFLSLVWIYLNNSGVEPIVSLFYVMFIVSGLIIGEMKFKKIPFSPPKKHWLMIGIVGVSSLLNNWSVVEGYKVAPNPNYVNAVNTGSIALVAIFSYIIFRDELKSRKLMGVIGVVIGLIMLFW